MKAISQSAMRIFFYLLLLLLPGLVRAQLLFQVQATPLKPTRFGFDSYNLPGYEGRVLIKPVGIEYGRYSTRYNTKRNQGFQLLTTEFANLKIRFKVKERDDEVTKYSYVTIGYEAVNQAKELAAHSRGLTKAEPNEPALIYTDYNIVARYQSRMLSLGVERVKEVERNLKKRHPHLTKTLYAQALYNLYNTDTLSIEKAYQSVNHSILVNPADAVLEPLMVNRVGFKAGYKMCSLKPIGYSFALEAGMITAPFNINGVYGNGFPDDNLFVQTQIGLSFGHSWKK